MPSKFKRDIENRNSYIWKKAAQYGVELHNKSILQVAREICRAARCKFPDGVGKKTLSEAILRTVLGDQDVTEKDRLPRIRTPRLKPVAIKNESSRTRGNAAYRKRRDEFYQSWEWRILRVQVLDEQGRICKCCGARPGQLDMAGQPVRIVVDHIKSLSKHWELRLDKNNCQPLCAECNQGKSNLTENDYRDDMKMPDVIKQA